MPITGFIDEPESVLQAGGTPSTPTSIFSGAASDTRDGNTGTALLWNVGRSDAVSMDIRLRIDFGAGNEKAITRSRIFQVSTRGIPGWRIRYSDDGSTYTSAFTFVTTEAGGVWDDSGPKGSFGAHRYWELQASTPGTGGNAVGIAEWELYGY